MNKTRVSIPVPTFPNPIDEQPEATFRDKQNEMDRTGWRGVSIRMQIPGSNAIQHEDEEPSVTINYPR